MLTARFVALPAIALSVIVALAQAHGHTRPTSGTTPVVLLGVSCAVAPAGTGCTVANIGGATFVR